MGKCILYLENYQFNTCHKYVSNATKEKKKLYLYRFYEKKAISHSTLISSFSDCYQYWDIYKIILAFLEYLHFNEKRIEKYLALRLLVSSWIMIF